MAQKNIKTDQLIDFNRVKFILAKHWYLYLLSIFIGSCYFFIYKKYTPLLFNIGSSIMIKNSNMKPSNLSGGYYYYFYQNNKNITNEINIIKSNHTIGLCIKELNFGISYFVEGNIKTTEIFNKYPINVEFDSTSGYIPFDQMIQVKYFDSNHYDLIFNGEEELTTLSGKYKYGDWIDFHGCKLKILINLQNFKSQELRGNILFRINNFSRQVNSYKSSIAVTPFDSEGSMLSISMQTYNLEKDILFINKLMDIYRLESLHEKNESNNKTIDFINTQLTTILDTLNFVGKKIDMLEQGDKEYFLDQEDRNPMGKLTMLKSSIYDAELKHNYFVYLIDFLETNTNYEELIMPMSVGIENPHIETLVTKLLELQLEKKLDLNNSTIDNPLIVDNSYKIEKVGKAIYESIIVAKESNERNLSELNKMVQEEIAKKSNIVAKDPMLKNIKRVYEVNQEIYSFLIMKKAEAGINKAANIPDIKIMSKASQLGPPLPDFLRLKILIIFLSLSIPTVIIFLIYNFSSKILFKSDLVRKTNLPVLGEIGHTTKSGKFISENPKSAIAEAFRSIRSNLLFINSSKSSNIYAITSSKSGEGKSFFSINLASILAMSPKKTIFIGADLRKPSSIRNFMDIKTDKGLSDYLVDIVSLDDIIQKSSIDHLDIIINGSIPPNPAELLMKDKFKIFINKLKERYECIVFDTPPIGLVTDAKEILKYSDVNLFITRQNYSNLSALNDLNDYLEHSEYKNFYMILNDVRNIKIGYYNSEYGYGYGYGYYDNSNPSPLKKLTNLITRQNG